MKAGKWSHRTGAVVAAAAVVLLPAVPAWACGNGHGPHAPSHETEARVAPTGNDSGARKNVEVVENLPKAKGAISINFISYGRKRDVMFVTGEFGLKAYSLRDPAHPTLIGELNIPGMWETEDTDVDPRRKLVFLSRDPRAFGGNTDTGESGIYVVDAKNPSNLRKLSYVKVPAGHTTTCVNHCRYLWTGGPAAAEWMPESWGGRPIWVTDMRNPRKPEVYPHPIDTHRDDGQTDYVHDVQVDANGVAWVSGAGGTRGYWTKGMHWDPTLHRYRTATARDPIPYAGGHIEQLNNGSDFMHNSFRPVGADSDEAPGNGELIYVTQETFKKGCKEDGKLVIASLQGSYDGQSWSSTPEDPFRLQKVGTWRVYGKEGSDPGSGSCSAHYFEVRDNILVQSFYEQGTRFLDVSDPSNPRQIAYFRPADANAWAPYWHGDYVYVADNARGVDVIALDRGGDEAST